MSLRRVIAAHALLAACLGPPAAFGGDKPAGMAPEPRAAAPAVAASGAASAPSMAASEASLDPMQRLRRRLAERLGGVAGTQASGSADLRLTVRSGTPARPGVHPVTQASPTPVVHAPGAPGAPGQRATRARTAAARLPAGGQGASLAPWGYEGATGPAAWGELKPEYALCANGRQQSPIDIRDGLAVGLEPVQFHYQPSRFGVLDNGRTVQVNVAQGNAIEIQGRRFELLQFHFHRPSEERIDGRQFEMSLHLVHRDAQGRLAVVAVLLDKGAANPALHSVWSNLPLERHEEVAARALIDPTELLPGERQYSTYMGSLTTPPCSEGVRWVVMRKPVTLAPEQLEIFARIYPMNSRPLQSAAGRRILQSN